MSTDKIATHGNWSLKGARIHSYNRPEDTEVLEVLTATCTPNSYPHDDGRVEYGFQINVMDPGLNILATVDLPDWELFHPTSAGDRLIEHGFMIHPEARTVGAVKGWRPTGSGWLTQVVPCHHEDKGGRK